jgi:FkbM family methyltransferase
MYARINDYTRTVRAVGFIPAVANKLRRIRMKRLAPGDTALMRSKCANFPLKCRAQSSDLRVFDQIFQKREYRCLDTLATADLIIDCGANAGYSAAYFLSRFPQATVVAIEPDTSNFEMLKENLRPYGERAICICSGIWSRPAGLMFAAESLGQGKEWGRTVREAVEGETPDVHAIDIGSILANSGRDRISILKIDIEGSEAAVFSEHYEAWIDKVDSMVIELHSSHCEEIFGKAIHGRGFLLSRCDELTVCERAIAPPLASGLPVSSRRVA